MGTRFECNTRSCRFQEIQVSRIGAIMWLHKLSAIGPGLKNYELRVEKSVMVLGG